MTWDPSLHSVGFFAAAQNLSYLCRYEDEINRRTGAENEFVVLKKVSKEGVREGGME